MSQELKGELPSGYIWKECFNIRARFPMPDTWFFKAENAPGTSAFFMTREPIKGESFLVSMGGVTIKTGKPENHFTTGLSVNVLFNIKQKRGMNPSEMAKTYMTSQIQLIATSRITRQQDGSLYAFRRFFQLGTRVVMGKKMENTNFYIEFSGNDETGTAYIIMFETPSAKWKDDAEIARTMIEKRILDPSI